MPFWLLFIMFLVTTTSVCAAPQMRDFEFGGVLRNYLVADAPAAGSKPFPVVVVLHGGQGDALQTERYTGMTDTARRNGFLAVYPNGLDKRWNDARGQLSRTAKHDTPVDDVGFLIAVADQLSKEGLADPSRVFLTGISNGAMMTLLAVCQRPDRFRAMAPISGSLPVGSGCEAKLPIPALIFHGTADEYIPFAGGPVAAIRGRPALGYVQSAQATVDAIAKANGCAPPAGPPEIVDKDPQDGTRVRIDTYRCPPGAPLRHVVIEGGGHSWPGNNQKFLADWILGRSTREADANQMMLDFFNALPPR